MTELNSFLESINKDNKKDVRDIIAFLQDNGWFGTKPVFENGKYMLSDKQNLLYTQKITDFLNGSRMDIYNKLQELYPETSKKLRQFADEEETDEISEKAVPGIKRESDSAQIIIGLLRSIIHNFRDVLLRSAEISEKILNRICPDLYDGSCRSVYCGKAELFIKNIR